MMTVHKLSAGDGYAYYISETVSADQQRERGQELGDYYTASGNPPGLWMGSGIDALGVSGSVSEAQMKALYGEGLHPDAERIIAERIAAGDTAKRAMRAAKLGRKYMSFVEKDTPFGRKLNEELETFSRLHHREPSAKERADIRGKVGAVHFRSEHGRSPASKEELGRFIKEQEGGKQRNAVAGYDLVFSAPKSVSVLWGLGDDGVRKLVEQAHVQALTETLEWLEQKAAMTRTGVNGIAQEDIAGGLIATRFRHYSNRLGQAMLHDHLVVSNKVQGRDGKWRSLDGQLLFMQGVAASELYNQRVVEGVCERLGLRAEAREVTPGKRPVMEIAGIGADLMEAHSGRAISIKERTAELVEEYRDRHGYEPSAKALLAITQQATLDTRPDKEAARPLSELRDEWRQQAIEGFGSKRIDGLLETARAAAAQARPGPEAVPHLDIEKAAQEVLETVSDHRSVWGRRQILAEARRWVLQATTGAAPGGDLADRITDLVLATQSIDITPPDLNPTFEPLTRDDGTSIYRRRESELYTSTAVLAAEDRIVAAARTRVIPAVSGEVYARVEAAYQEANPNRRLDAGQRALARTFATSERLVAAGIGPAGAGKTTAMKVAADAVRASGGRVIGLGPSARAAAELSAGLEAPAFVLHDWLGARERAQQGKPIRPEYALGSGDVIIVDEAGMAGSKRLAGIVAEAERAGAVVRLIGDPFQLSAVESGGALRLLANTVDVVELESVHRFRTPGEAAASLSLRSGEPDTAWAWYLDNQRVVAGTREQMVHQIFADWQSDIAAGRTALMMADDNASVAELNQLAQAYRMGSGQLDMRRTVAVREGVEAHRGDLIVTRKNDRINLLRSGKDFVKNGDQWQITRVKSNGDIEVRHTDHGGRTILKADYVAKYTELGYASTGHRGQGATVDTGSGLLTRRTARESAYVQTTRGRQQNRLYVVLDEGMTMRDVLDTIARNTQASVSATEAIRAEQDRAWGIGQLAAEYNDVHARALSLRYQSMARNVLGLGAEAIIAEDAWPAVERALRDAERAGFAPERILSTAFYERDFADAEDNAAVLSWRIDNHVAEARDTLRRLEEQGVSRPLKDLTEAQLDRLAERAGERRTQALDELRRADARVDSQPRSVVIDGLPTPAWPGREHGDLTRTQLSRAIAEARRDGRTAGREGDREQARAAALRLGTLKEEQRLRSSMTWRDRAREDWQREPGTGHAHTVGMNAETIAAEMRANLHDQDEARQKLDRAAIVDQRVQAEQRLRRLLPDGPAPTPENSGRLPEWLAPREVERDQHTPMAWLDHLDARRQVIDARLTQTGQALAANPPAWAKVLGPVPSPGTELREEWERTAALADAWRTQRQLRDSEHGVGSQPAGGRDADAWQVLHDQVAEVGRRSRATEAAARRGDALADTWTTPDATTSQATSTAPAPVAVAEESVEPSETVMEEGEDLALTPEPEQTIQADAATAAADDEQLPEPSIQAVREDIDEEAAAAADETEAVGTAADVELPASEERHEEVERHEESHAEQPAPELTVPDEEPQRSVPAVDAEEIPTDVDQVATENLRSRDERDQEEVVPAAATWETRPYGTLSDTALSAALAQTVEAAEAAQEQAAAQEARAAELLAAVAPGGAAEQSVHERAERVQAIQDLRAVPGRMEQLNRQAEQQRDEVRRIEARLEEKNRLGRPAVRGDERQQMETSLSRLRTAVEDTSTAIESTRRQEAESRRVAGNPAEHDRVLADWEKAGGSREAVLERTVAARQRRAENVLAEAGAARDRVGQLDSAAAKLRQEMNLRDAQPYGQRIAEDAQRLQVQQQALEVEQQQGPQMPGPDQGPSRGTPKV
ncbi:conjugative relaxase-like TrwC/TraI family protein [Streptomyces sp. KhCrAH-43]|uniref:MobF family relaxase n=1 Tax=unclassified Streptomyces TaxID=2593676 RepID=UPI00036517D2|nr:MULTISPECIES: MobF family relaxase [unclassified Streptomyces]MYS32931.1 relaxase domain-containing protein [Streptomyces sp. SID4920]MYX64278.1 relaxase domain-containing protein [Streptomyces sp. SID8373]RAJ48674.1 conjugative relaxase-like TrwC/TraI family protein [Streptomyces sp. KhCrAH-43]